MVRIGLLDQVADPDAPAGGGAPEDAGQSASPEPQSDGQSRDGAGSDGGIDAAPEVPVRGPDDTAMMDSLYEGADDDYVSLGERSNGEATELMDNPWAQIARPDSVWPQDY